MKKIGCILVIICFALMFCAGCSKDSILGFYKGINETLGDTVLTNKNKLKGTREFSSDHYTGTYSVTYNNFTGEEVIFGGTTIERDENDIHIKLNIEDSKGDIKVIMKLKENEEILATEDGNYQFDFNVKDGSNYLIIRAEKYSGKVDIEID